MQITLNRCTLREWNSDDIPSLAHHANNINIWRNVRDHFPHPYTEADARFYIEQVIPAAGQENFAIMVDGQAAGGIGLVRQTDVERFSAEIGYWLGEAHWNRGIVTEAVQAVVAFAFTQTDLIRLFAPVFAYNAASMRVLEKCGFRLVGILHNAAVKNGETIDLHYYELTK